MFPKVRMRRLRNKKWLRDLVSENNIAINDLIWPCFVIKGQNIEQNIESLPGVKRYSIDRLLLKLEEAISLGIRAIAIFPVIEQELKNDNALEALNKDNLIFQAVVAIREKFPQLGIITDVALDLYTDHGHDGILGEDGLVDNDQTVEILAKYSKLLSDSGSDMVAPSDMMDGRIQYIRDYLDSHDSYNTSILAYAAKYASNFYFGFRDAVGNKNSVANKSDKKHYQMNFANINEAIREIELDINEGADIVMVKPGLHYLDVIREAKNKFNIHIWAYHVSSEYAMLKNAAINNILDYDKCLLETMTCFKRAGTGAILTYAALDVAKILNEI